MTGPRRPVDGTGGPPPSALHQVRTGEEVVAAIREGASPDPARADTGLGCEDSVSPSGSQPTRRSVWRRSCDRQRPADVCAQPG